MKIFISYSRTDKPQILEIVQALKIHDVWFDDRLNLGQEWWAEIEGQIATCHCFMYVLSPESLTSEYCQREWAVAQKLHKPVAPVLLKSSDIPAELNKLQIIDIRSGLLPEATIRLLNGLFEIERIVSNPLRRDSHQFVQQNSPKLSISDLAFVTTNENKQRDYEQILGVKINVIPIKIDDIQHLDAAEVALNKAEQAYQILKKPVFVDQTALSIRAWGGFPGGMATSFILTVGVNNLCRMLHEFDDRYAEAISVIAFVDRGIKRKFIGVQPGTIADKAAPGGYGWGAAFVPEGFNRTQDELSREERLSISRRRIAILEFMRFLKTNYDIE